MNKQCRICLAEEGDNNSQDLGAWLRPCRCKGTQEWVHVNCLEAWRSQIHNVHPDYCTTCNTRFPDSTCLKGCCRTLRNRATFKLIEAAKVLGPVIAFCVCVLFLELKCDVGVPIVGDNLRMLGGWPTRERLHLVAAIEEQWLAGEKPWDELEEQLLRAQNAWEEQLLQAQEASEESLCQLQALDAEATKQAAEIVNKSPE